jgi:glutamine synthetase
MDNQTVEFRSPDGSANVHQLLAGLTVAALYGLDKEDALQIAERLYVSEDASRVEGLNQLPASCHDAAEALLKDRQFYENYDVFPPGMIDKIAEDLKAYGDQNMSEKLFGNADALRDIVNQYIHCG